MGDMAFPGLTAMHRHELEAFTILLVEVSSLHV